MKDLMELVTASLARHGIQCPADDFQSVGPVPAKPAQAIPRAEPILTTALPEHNFRKSLQGDPAP